MLDAQPAEILVRRNADLLAEYGGEAVQAAVAHARELGERQRLSEMLFHMAHDPANGRRDGWRRGHGADLAWRRGPTSSAAALAPAARAVPPGRGAPPPALIWGSASSRAA